MVESIQKDGLIRVAILGPESSGKTSLFNALILSGRWHGVEEFSRTYLHSIRWKYGVQDLEYIAQKQYELNASVSSPSLCDTELSTVAIWAQEKLGFIPPIVRHLEATQQFDLYLLCRPDLPWKEDPLRENPLDRDRLFNIYQERLTSLHRPFKIIEGVGEGRLKSAELHISSF